MSHNIDLKQETVLSINKYTSDSCDSSMQAPNYVCSRHNWSLFIINCCWTEKHLANKCHQAARRTGITYRRGKDMAQGELDLWNSPDEPEAPRKRVRGRMRNTQHGGNTEIIYTSSPTLTLPHTPPTGLVRSHYGKPHLGNWSKDGRGIRWGRGGTVT